MAIARKIDPNVLARAFADEIRTIPEVERVWYRYRQNSFAPERMSLDIMIQLKRESDTADTAIATALTRLQAEFWDTLSVGGFQFTHADNDMLDDLIGPSAIELRLDGV
jgi:hypothetical protein